MAADRAGPAAQGEPFLFTYFVGNGEDGLHLAWSDDGFRWQLLGDGRSFLHPHVGKAKLIRDPCAVLGPDGAYHMVWTSGWWENGIGYASTKDFVHWSDQREIPVMAHEPAVRNCWAPEVAYDAKRDEFIIFWASTIPGRFPETAGASEDELNHRMYFTTTKDFVTFAPTEVFLDPGFSVIDASFVEMNGRHHLIIKDETRNPPKKHLRIGEAGDLRGPFREFSAPFSPVGVWVEGPTAIQIGDRVVVYYDAYQDKRYGALSSRNLVHWDDVSAKLDIPNEGTPERFRHGTILRVPRLIIEKLQSEETDP